MHIRDSYIAHYRTEERHAIDALIGYYTAEMTDGGIHWKFTNFDSQTKFSDFTV